eukprot:681340-Amphidinium_carterae.2
MHVKRIHGTKEVKVKPKSLRLSIRCCMFAPIFELSQENSQQSLQSRNLCHNGYGNRENGEC